MNASQHPTAQQLDEIKACPSCGDPMELVRAEDGGEIDEPYFPKYPLRDHPLPRRRRPASFFACPSCEHCEEIGVPGLKSHEVVEDRAGGGYERLTCLRCLGATCLRAPHMSDSQWQQKVSAWREAHPAVQR